MSIFCLSSYSSPNERHFGEAVGSGETGQVSFEEGLITRIFEHTNPGALGTGRPTRAIEAVCAGKVTVVWSPR
jgi:hypothetical protein